MEGVQMELDGSRPCTAHTLHHRPFVALVIANLFANIPKSECRDPGDRWLTNDHCLCFIEHALASFDLESLVRASDDSALKGSDNGSIVALLVHPGYEIIQRLLTNSPLQTSILTYCAPRAGSARHLPRRTTADAA
jgi:hypothetical protein